MSRYINPYRVGCNGFFDDAPGSVIKVTFGDGSAQSLSVSPEKRRTIGTTNGGEE